MTKEIRSTRVVRRVDTDPDVSWLSQEERYADLPASDADNYRRQDAQRLAAFHRGDWQMTGVFAEAEIIVNGTIQRVQSGGLWGIESDSSEDYFREIAEEQKDELADALAELGFTPEEIRLSRPVGTV